MSATTLANPVAQAIDRLGLSAGIRPDLDGLRQVYRAWCLNVPFDNIAKVTALRTNAPGALPGTTADEFLQNWLDHNAGGTCWNTSNALYTVLTTLGFDTIRATGSMFDMGWDNHGTTIVRIDGEEWLVDSSMLTLEPLPLRPGQVHIQDDRVNRAEIDPEGDGFLLWATNPPLPGLILCRLLEKDVPESLYAANYERSREMSPFNGRLFARRAFEGRVLVLFGNQRHELTADGLASQDLSPEELVATLTDTFGYSRSLIDAWVASGGLELAFQPMEGPGLPPITRVCPSERAKSV
jgi:arylamine N-acetyltransferase